MGRSLCLHFSSLLVWMGLQVAVQPHNEDHRYGYGKAEPLAALVAAVFAGWIGWSAICKITTSHRATLPLLAGFVAVKMWFSARMNQAGEAAGSTGLKVEVLHHYSGTVTCAATFVGIATALSDSPFTRLRTAGWRSWRAE